MVRNEFTSDTFMIAGELKGNMLWDQHALEVDRVLQYFWKGAELFCSFIPVLSMVSLLYGRILNTL